MTARPRWPIPVLAVCWAAILFALICAPLPAACVPIAALLAVVAYAIAHL